MRENIIKIQNLEKLRKIFLEKKSATKSELAEMSGLSVVTINSLVKTLLANNEIIEDKVIQPELGRPALSFRFNENVRLALVICMFENNRQDNVCYYVCNLYGETIYTVEEENKITTECFDNNIRKLLDKYPNIKTIGFSIPGVEYDGRFIICDYPELNTEFPKIIKNKYNVDVFIENDINSATLGCYMANPVDSIIGIYLPSKYPPGSAICLNGSIVKGRNNLAGEIKYLPFGINWETFSYLKQDIEEFLLNVIRIYMCIYNPEQIIVYGDIKADIIEKKLAEILTTENEKLMLPKITVKSNLKPDIKSGLVSSALKKIL